MLYEGALKMPAKSYSLCGAIAISLEVSRSQSGTRSGIASASALTQIGISCGEGLRAWAAAEGGATGIRAGGEKCSARIIII